MKALFAKEKFDKVVNLAAQAGVRSSSVELMDYIQAIEKALGMVAKKNFMPMQAGDVVATYADVQDLMKDVGFKPSTTVEDGIKYFVDWYRMYYQL
ncbi:MAG: hypothetical protein Q9M18_04330 [Mariprofundaceae bacterium]|nr:hypothetical protein [Mariprofundaceae bacterium]